MAVYVRKKLYNNLSKSLNGNVNLIQVIVGPRQIGKTTLALQLFKSWQGPKLYDTADEPGIVDRNFIISKWTDIRQKYEKYKKKSLLILDEIQKIHNCRANALKRVE